MSMMFTRYSTMPASRHAEALRRKYGARAVLPNVEREEAAMDAYFGVSWIIEEHGGNLPQVLWEAARSGFGTYAKIKTTQDIVDIMSAEIAEAQSEAIADWKWEIENGGSPRGTDPSSEHPWGAEVVAYIQAWLEADPEERFLIREFVTQVGKAYVERELMTVIEFGEAEDTLQEELQRESNRVMGLFLQEHCPNVEAA